MTDRTDIRLAGHAFVRRPQRSFELVRYRGFSRPARREARVPS